MDRIIADGRCIIPIESSKTGLPMFISIISIRAYEMARFKSLRGQWHTTLVEFKQPIEFTDYKIMAYNIDAGVLVAVKKFKHKGVWLT